MAAQDHQFGHRHRLRDRFLAGGETALSDYELLELILFAAKPRGDVKPLAKDLLKTFGDFAKTIRAPESDLLKIKGMGPAAISALKVIECASEKLLRTEVMERPVLSSWKQLTDYCQLTMGHLSIEQLRILYLDRQNKLIRDEVLQQGTIDHTPVYPREVIKKALDVGASAIIIVHNHPSGDPTPSRADMVVTQEIQDAGEKLGVLVHDHIVVGHGCFVSFRAKGFLK